jgi:hypothetical protein
MNSEVENNMKWLAKFTGPCEGSGTIMGRPIIALLVSRESGAFTPDEVSRPTPEGWVSGDLVATTKGARRTLRARVIARVGGQWNWDGGFDTPGTRHFDFAPEGNEVEIMADKPSAESWFAAQLAAHGWQVTDAE